MSMYVWEDGTVTGSVNVNQLLAEHPDHPVAKRLLAERGESQAAEVAPEPGETVASIKDKLRELGLPTSGNKDELMERLREAAEDEGEES